MTKTNRARRPAPAAAEFLRPAPPASLADRGPDDLFGPRFAPAHDVLDWVNRTIIEPGGPLHNPDHAHLEGADLGILWACTGFAKAGRYVLGQAEQVMIRAGGWQKARQEDQLIAWFGRVPAFLITLAADYCAGCSDLEFCALVEHELYHLGQASDGFGAPAFHKDGRPKLMIRGHDVEEFTGVVRRYGATTEVSRLLDATRDVPEVSRLNLARACGCCLKAA
ncbi:putative metallopeptidase [Achromobacter aloeverae]